MIRATKSHFARHCIADMITDNGPQYSSDQFAPFTREWEFQHTTSSPLHSQSNVKADSAVKIAKYLVKKAKRENKDLEMALLERRNTPDINNLRVAVCKDRESAVSDPFGESLIFCPKLALGRLFSKFIFKSSNHFVYLGNLRKIKSAVKMRSKCGFLILVKDISSPSSPIVAPPSRAHLCQSQQMSTLNLQRKKKENRSNLRLSLQEVAESALAHQDSQTTFNSQFMN